MLGLLPMFSHVECKVTTDHLLDGFAIQYYDNHGPGKEVKYQRDLI